MTTAANTGFALKSTEVNGLTFYFDGNQKITAGNGSFDKPAANAFSLVQVQDCPFRTATCEATCYVHNLEVHQPVIHNAYRVNSTNIRAVLAHSADTAASAFARWISEHAQGGFRWHVSGDVFSLEYARFISRVAQGSPTVNHWIYTRSFPFVAALTAPNLAVNISADKDNYWRARAVADQHRLRVCYLTIDGEVPEDMRKGDVIFPDYALRGPGMEPHTYRKGSQWWQWLQGEHRKMVCPVDTLGKSEGVRCGPCSRCMGVQ